MAKRGSKGKSHQQHVATGTDRADRVPLSVVQAVDEPYECPGWISDEAREIWERRVAIYDKRGQDVAGLEDQLAHYCELEVSLREKWQEKRGPGPTMAQINAYRYFCNEFFDTPASQLVRPKKDKQNSFAEHGI